MTPNPGFVQSDHQSFCNNFKMFLAKRITASLGVKPRSMPGCCVATTLSLLRHIFGVFINQKLKARKTRHRGVSCGIRRFIFESIWFHDDVVAISGKITSMHAQPPSLFFPDFSSENETDETKTHVCKRVCFIFNYLLLFSAFSYLASR